MRATRFLAVAAMLLVPGAPGQAEAPPGAASCSGCHAASARVDTAVPRLAGRSAAELASGMQAFKSGQKPGTVMGRIAKGFSEAEIQAIADWYAAQK
jgi:cytochrome subunit of sulfide dehydrogenase